MKEKRMVQQRMVFHGANQFVKKNSFSRQVIKARKFFEINSRCFMEQISWQSIQVFLCKLFRT